MEPGRYNNIAAFLAQGSTMTCTPSPSGTDSHNFEVCLVDDDEIMRDLLLRYLVKLKCEVTTAADPQEALETIASQKFELVMTDLYMPDMKDGLGFVSSVKEQHPALRVIVMSAEMSQSTRDMLMSAGAFACLVKPISSTDLAGMLANVASSRSAA